MSQPKLLQVISRWENVLIETIAISVIIISAAVTANYFGWPSPDPTVKAAAAVYAYGVDGMFYVCVRLARHYLSYGFSARGVGLGLFWMLLSALMGAFTWHNNLLFAATSWHISAQALARVGFSDAEELQLHAIIPVAVVLIVAVIPRRHVKEVRTPEQIIEDARQQAALLQAQNMLRSIKAQGAGQALSTSVGGFLGKALKLDERKARQDAERKQREEADRQHEEQRAYQKKLWSLATPEMRAACVHDGEDETWTDYEQLEQMLLAAGMMPFQKTIDAVAVISTTQPDMPALPEGKKPVKTHYTIAEAESESGIPARTIRQRIATGKLPVAEKKGAHGATLLTYNAVQKLRDGKVSNPHLAAKGRQEAKAQDGNQVAEDTPTTPRLQAANQQGNLAVDEEIE